MKNTLQPLLEYINLIVKSTEVFPNDTLETCKEKYGKRLALMENYRIKLQFIKENSEQTLNKLKEQYTNEKLHQQQIDDFMFNIKNNVKDNQFFEKQNQLNQQNILKKQIFEEKNNYEYLLEQLQHRRNSVNKLQTSIQYQSDKQELQLVKQNNQQINMLRQSFYDLQSKNKELNKQFYIQLEQIAQILQFKNEYLNAIKNTNQQSKNSDIQNSQYITKSQINDRKASQFQNNTTRLSQQIKNDDLAQSQLNQRLDEIKQSVLEHNECKKAILLDASTVHYKNAEIAAQKVKQKQYSNLIENQQNTQLYSDWVEDNTNAKKNQNIQVSTIQPRCYLKVQQLDNKGNEIESTDWYAKKTSILGKQTDFETDKYNQRLDKCREFIQKLNTPNVIKVQEKKQKYFKPVIIDMQKGIILDAQTKQKRYQSVDVRELNMKTQVNAPIWKQKMIKYEKAAVDLRASKYNEQNSELVQELKTQIQNYNQLHQLYNYYLNTSNRQGLNDTQIQIKNSLTQINKLNKCLKK